MGKKIKNEQNISQFLNERRGFIEETIKEIQIRIGSIDSQLISLEKILDDIKQKLDYFENQNKYTEKSRLIRWYIEDIKIYNELNEIRSKYEKLLMDYNEQLINSKFKFEELELKKRKLDADTSDMEQLIKKMYEEIENLRNNSNSNKLKINTDDNEFDEIYQL